MLQQTVKEDLRKKKKSGKGTTSKSPGHSILKITGFYDYKYQVSAFSEHNNLILISLLLAMFCEIRRKQKGQHVVDVTEMPTRSV